MNILICNCDVFKIVIKMFLMGSFKNCIQYLFSLFLYNQIRIFKKGIKILFRYRCVRGFIFLEFFYLYLNRFIFSEIIVCGLILILLIGIDFEFCMLQVLVLMMFIIRYFFQRGFIGGIRIGFFRSWRWRFYCFIFIVIFVNQLLQIVQGNFLDLVFQYFRVYIGELIGVEYLYFQIGKVF